jgi:hypothetical protein
MLLEAYCFVGKDADDSAYWWICINSDNCLAATNGEVIAAPEYDWIYWYEGIPERDLLEDAGLKAEWEQAKARYLNRRQSNAAQTNHQHA